MVGLWVCVGHWEKYYMARKWFSPGVHVVVGPFCLSGRPLS